MANQLIAQISIGFHSDGTSTTLDIDLDHAPVGIPSVDQPFTGLTGDINPEFSFVKFKPTGVRTFSIIVSGNPVVVTGTISGSSPTLTLTFASALPSGDYQITPILVF